MIKKVKNTVQWTYVISDRNGDKIVVTFNKKKKKRIGKNKSNRV